MQNPTDKVLHWRSLAECDPEREQGWKQERRHDGLPVGLVPRYEIEDQHRKPSDDEEDADHVRLLTHELQRPAADGGTHERQRCDQHQALVDRPVIAQSDPPSRERCKQDDLEVRTHAH